LNNEGEIKGRFPGVVYCSSAAVQCTEEGGISVSTKERGHNKHLRHDKNGYSQRSHRELEMDLRTLLLTSLFIGNSNAHVGCFGFDYASH